MTDCPGTNASSERLNNLSFSAAANALGIQEKKKERKGKAEAALFFVVFLCLLYFILVLIVLVWTHKKTLNLQNHVC